MGYYFLAPEHSTRHPVCPPVGDPLFHASDGLASADPETRRRLLELLISARCEALLVRLLANPNPAVHRSAAAGLWEIWLSERGSEAKSELLIGIDALRLGQTEGALTLFETTMVRYPGWAEAINKTATVLYVLGHPKCSLNLCREVIRLKPHHFGAWNGIVLCAIALDDWSTARTALHRYHRLVPFAEDIAELSAIVA